MTNDPLKWTHVIIIASWGNPAGWRVARYKPELIIPKDFREKTGNKRVLSLEHTYSNSSSLAMFESLLIDEKLRWEYRLIDNDTKFALIIYMPMTLVLENERFLNDIETSNREFCIDDIDRYIKEFVSERVKEEWSKALKSTEEQLDSNDKYKLEINKSLAEKLFEVVSNLKAGHAYAEINANEISLLKDKDIDNKIVISIYLYPVLATKFVRRANKNDILYTTLLEIKSRTLTELKSVLITDLIAGFYVGGLVDTTNRLKFSEGRSSGQVDRVLLISDITHGLNYATSIFSNTVDICASILSIFDSNVDVNVMNSDPYPYSSTKDQTIIPSLKIHCVRSQSLRANSADAITNILGSISTTVKILSSARESLQLLYIASSLYEKLPVIVGFVADALMSNNYNDVLVQLKGFMKLLYNNLKLSKKKEHTEGLRKISLIFNVNRLSGDKLGINPVDEDKYVEPSLLTILSLVILYVARTLVRGLFNVENNQRFTAKFEEDSINIIVERVSEGSLIREREVILLIRENYKDIVTKCVPETTAVLIERELENMQGYYGAKAFVIRSEHLCRLIAKSKGMYIDINTIRNAIAHPLFSGSLFRRLTLEADRIILTLDIDVLRSIFKQLVTC